jgi:hypothetical protein
MVALALLAGCGKGDFPTAEVTGRVVCEGQPVSNVLVFFEPLERGQSAVVGKQGIGRTKPDGTFTVSTYGDGDGAVVGAHRVRVGWMEGKVDPSCPCQVNSEQDIFSELEVKKGEKNEFELKLRKKEPGQRPSPEEVRALREQQEEEED